MRSIEITYTEGNRARLNLCFVDRIRDQHGKEERREHECVKLDPDDPVYDYALSWIRDGHIPIVPKNR